MNANQKGAMTQTTITTTVSTVMAVLAAFGFVHFQQPETLIKRVDPKVLQQMARPDAFTRSDFNREIARREAEFEARLETRMEKKLAPMQAQLSILQEAFAEFALFGPRQVNEKLDTIIAEAREQREQDRKQHNEMLRGQQRHFDETKTLFNQHQTHQRRQIWPRY